LAILLLISLCSCPAWGQVKGLGVEVHHVTPVQRDVVPGTITSFSFQVTNRTAMAAEFLEELHTPAGWLSLVPEGSFPLDPGTTTARVYAVLVPKDAPAGRYTLAYAVRSQQNPAVQDRVAVDVVVLPFGKLTLLVEEQPDIVVAGTPFTVTLRAINVGNAPLSLSLSLDSPSAYRVQIAPSHLELAPGESAPVTVSVRTDMRLTRPFTLYLPIMAKAHSPEGREISSAVSVRVDIMPRASEAVDLSHYLPTELLIRPSGDEDSAGLQVEVRGAGTLDAAGTREIDFLFRTPNTLPMGIFGLYDEFHVNYAYQGTRVRLGDATYGVSRLTDYFRYGRGFGVDSTVNDRLGWGTYYTGSRWRAPDARAGGVYLSYRADAHTHVKVNYASIGQGDTADRFGAYGRFASLETAFRPTADVAVQAEYGVSSGGAITGYGDTGYRVRVDGREGERLYYTLETIHADPNFTGYYSDCDYTTGTITLPLGSRLQANATMTSWKRNLALRPAALTAPRERQATWGVRYNFPAQWYATLGYQTYERRDAMPLMSFDLDEETLRLGIGRSSRRANYLLEFHNGRQYDHLTHRTSGLQEYKVFAGYRLTPQHYVTLFASHSNRRQTGYLASSSDNAGLSLNWQPLPNFTLTAWYNDYDYNNDLRRRNQGDLSARYLLWNGQSIQARARRSDRRAGEGSSTSYELVYRIPINLAMEPDTAIGAVRGRIVDSEQPGTPGVANVIVTINGTAAMTDARGEFVIPRIKPGDYLLNVDRRSIGLHRIPVQQMPMPLTITGGEVAQVEVAVVTGASVSGVVSVVSVDDASSDEAPVLYGAPDKTTLAGQRLANILIELRNGSEVFRTTTNAQGMFQFQGVHPGPWRLTVYDHNLPAYHVLEQSTHDLTLQAGERIDLPISVRPRARRIKLLEDGGVVQEQKVSAVPGVPTP
jgi:hypothetical protein